MMSRVKQGLNGDVSRVVNGNKNVKENTRKKVLEVIERLRLSSECSGSWTCQQETTTGGVVIPNITNSYFLLWQKGLMISLKCINTILSLLIVMKMMTRKFLL